MTAELDALPRLLDENDVAAFTGASLTTVQRWRREGRGPAYRKIGRLVRYRRDDLADWIGAAHRISTRERPERQADQEGKVAPA